MAKKEMVLEDEIDKMVQDADVWILDSIASNDYNFFDVMGMARAEIRHSYVLKWLLDPHSPHRLGSSVLQGLMHYIMETMTPEDEIRKKLEREYFEDIAVFREKDNIDICVVGNRFVLCIENKVDSGEHDDQLIRYGDSMESLCEGSRVPLFILLSPDGRDAKKFRPGDNWIPVTYRSMKGIITDAFDKMVKSGSYFEDKVRVFIEEYTKLLEREFGDMTERERENLDKVKRFYFRHQAAIDYMMEQIDDRFLMTDFLENWLEKDYKPEYDDSTQDDTIILRKKKEKGIVRFTTEKLNRFIPPVERGWWGDESAYYYEIDAKNKDMNSGEFKIILRLIFGYPGAELVRPELDDVYRLLKGSESQGKESKTVRTISSLSPISFEALKDPKRKRQFKEDLKTQLDFLLAETQGKL